MREEQKLAREQDAAAKKARKEPQNESFVKGALFGRVVANQCSYRLICSNLHITRHVLDGADLELDGWCAHGAQKLE